MEKLIRFLVEAIVDYPQDIQIDAHTIDGGSVTYRLYVHPDDVGKVIGRQGRMAKSLRQILAASAHRQGLRVQLEIEAKR